MLLFGKGTIVIGLDVLEGLDDFWMGQDGFHRRRLGPSFRAHACGTTTTNAIVRIDRVMPIANLPS